MPIPGIAATMSARSEAGLARYEKGGSPGTGVANDATSRFCVVAGVLALASIEPRVERPRGEAIPLATPLTWGAHSRRTITTASTTNNVSLYRRVWQVARAKNAARHIPWRRSELMLVTATKRNKL